MTPNPCRSTVALAFTALGLLTLIASQVWAAETEVREFTIEIDGKGVGQYTMTVTKQDDGILSMKGQANITYKHLLGTYNYSFGGVEHWKEGRLLQMVSKCNDDGKPLEVNASADREWLRLKVNGVERNCRWDVWTTSYWLLADPRFHNQAVPLLDADTGKECVGQLKHIGVAPILVGGQQQNCHHFRVTGCPNSPVDLWFDGQHRLVRQEFNEQGKHVVFVLKSVRR